MFPRTHIIKTHSASSSWYKVLFLHFNSSGALEPLTLKLISYFAVARCLFIHPPLHFMHFHFPSPWTLVYLSPLPSFPLPPLIALPVAFPNHSFPPLLGRSGRLGCFPAERRVPAAYLSISLVNISNNSINNTWAVINKLHKHPRRTSSLGSVLNDLVGDKGMMERLWCVAELSANSCGCVFFFFFSKGQRERETVHNGRRGLWLV